MEKPSKEFLDKTKALMQKRYDESSKIVNAKESDWSRYRDLYRNITKGREHTWEADLAIPKPYYIVSTVAPQILNTIFGVADFLTLKHPEMDSQALTRLGKWFVWFLLKRMDFFMRCVEMFTATPMVGTSLLKLCSWDGSPTMDFLHAHEFLPDPACRKPGDVDSMSWCFHKFSRELGQLERAVVTRTGIEYVSYQDELGNPVSTPVPRVREEPLYFNLSSVWEKHLLGKGTEMEGTGTKVDIPQLELAEQWGEIETTFGVYDFSNKTYTPGRYEEYVVTSVLDGDKVETIIRCEPSTFYYTDPVIHKRKWLKPFVASIYSAVPGEFYGIGAIEPVESLITEMKEHHDLYLDEHKRSIMTILSVLERSGLTEDDLPFSPYALWNVRDHADINVLKFPELNLGAFQLIHSLLDREVDRTAGSSTLMQGVPTTKRQTLGEVQSLMMESARRFSVFIQMSDHLTLRPAAFKTLILLRSMPNVVEGKPFALPDGEVLITPEMLTEAVEFSFAATRMEPEYSKYMKQDLFPRLLREIGGVMQASGSQYVLNMEEIMSFMEELYNFKDLGRFVQVARPQVPMDLLASVVGDDPQLQAALAEMMRRVQAVTEAEGGQGGGGQGQGQRGRGQGQGDKGQGQESRMQEGA